MEGCFNVVLRHVSSGAKFEHRMETPTLLAGADPRCGFLLPPEAASAKELLIQVLYGRVFCLGLGDPKDETRRIKGRPLGSSVVEVNGFEVQAFEERGANTEVERSLDFGDERKIGDPRIGQFELAMRNEGRRQVVVPLGRAVTIMGRSPRCRVNFNFWSASAFHAACVASSDGVWVVDLKSRTGTFVNEIPVRVYRLKIKDRLRIGPARFEFRAVSASAPVEEQQSPCVEMLAPTVTHTTPPAAEEEVFAVVSTLANALARNPGSNAEQLDAREIAQTLTDMLRVQSLQLEEMRRLTAYLATHKTLPAGLLTGGEPDSTLRSSAPSLIRPTGSLTGLGAEPDVHEWFQQENDEAESRSVARLVRKIFGSR